MVGFMVYIIADGSTQTDRARQRNESTCVRNGMTPTAAFVCYTPPIPAARRDIKQQSLTL
eukprot:5641145-Karenia_brevis.AAC.1